MSQCKPVVGTCSVTSALKEIKICPLDSSDFTIIPHYLSNSQLHSFKVKCPQSGGRGCQCQDKLEEAEEHIDVCDFLIVECRHLGCSAEMEREDYLLT